MRLKKLVLQGFKSFKDKTSVHFDGGITGIVGPNGCGKSNIVDALFWVMGEQSARHLRGQSMKDLIFSGSSKYGPGAFAEVNLLLENTEEKHIHIGKEVVSPREISISRKLYRNGDSEYRINGLPARLRDIQEVFMDTGAGVKSYSVVAQGEIDRLVQARPEERRAIIEEVAGITKFKLRKRESLRKIEQTNANLSRIKDLQSEVHKNLKSLERQAKKAEEARSLKKKIEKTDMIVNSHKEFELLKDFTHFNNLVREKKLKIEEWQTQKQALEVGLQEEQLKKTDLMDQIEAEQKIFNEKSKQLAGNEEKLNYLRRTQTEKVTFIEMKVKENTKTLEETRERKGKWQDLSRQHESLKDSERDQLSDLQKESETQNFQEGLQLKEETLSELRTELDQGKSSYFEVEQELFEMDSQAKRLAQNLQDISVEMEALEEQGSHVSSEMVQVRQEVNAAKEEVEVLEREFRDLTSKVNKGMEKKTILGQEIHQRVQELMGKESRLESLEMFNENHEDQEGGVREFLQNFQNDGTLLGDIVECEEKYIPAVQASLKTRLNAIVLRGEVATPFQWLEEKRLSADFLTVTRSEFSKIPGAWPLLDVVKIKSQKYQQVKQLLEGIYVTDQLDEGSLSVLKKSKFAVLVSQDGKRVVENLGNSLRIRCFNGVEKDQSILSRHHLIHQLQNEIALLRKEREKRGKAYGEVKQDYEEMSGQKESLREKLFQGQTALVSLRSVLEAKLAILNSGNPRIEVLRQRKETLSHERLKVLENEEQLNKKRDELKEMIDEKKTIIEEMGAEVYELRVQYVELKEELFVKQAEAKTFDDRIESLSQQVRDFEIQVNSNLKRLQENDEIISKYEAELKNIEEIIENLQKNNADSALRLRERELKLGEMKNQLSEILLGMEDREEEVKRLSRDINKDEKEIVAKEIKRSQIIIDEEQVVRNTFEKYRVNLRHELAKVLNLEVTTDTSGPLHLESNDLDGLADISEMYSMEIWNEQTQQTERTEVTSQPYEFHRRYGQDLKDQKVKLKQYKQALNRIGEINWQAIEDYERQKIRYQFLKNQKEELKTSISDLENAISKIDEKSRMRFKEAFEEVNARFEKVFPIIFGGGGARLKLIGSIDDPECGIDIIAQPPGKKMQNISLMSGGEKALTAVSLIFSIFLVKPSPFCLLDEVDAPLDDANVGRLNELLQEMSDQSQFILITHNKRTMEFNNTLYGVTMQEPGISTAVSVQLQ